MFCIIKKFFFHFQPEFDDNDVISAVGSFDITYSSFKTLNKNQWLDDKVCFVVSAPSCLSVHSRDVHFRISNPTEPGSILNRFRFSNSVYL